MVHIWRPEDNLWEMGPGILTLLSSLGSKASLLAKPSLQPQLTVLKSQSLQSRPHCTGCMADPCILGEHMAEQNCLGLGQVAREKGESFGPHKTPSRVYP